MHEGDHKTSRHNNLNAQKIQLKSHTHVSHLPQVWDWKKISKIATPYQLQWPLGDETASAYSSRSRGAYEQRTFWPSISVFLFLFRRTSCNTFKKHLRAKTRTSTTARWWPSGLKPRSLVASSRGPFKRSRSSEGTGTCPPATRTVAAPPRLPLHLDEEIGEPPSTVPKELAVASREDGGGAEGDRGARPLRPGPTIARRAPGPADVLRGP